MCSVLVPVQGAINPFQKSVLEPSACLTIVITHIYITFMTKTCSKNNRAKYSFYKDITCSLFCNFLFGQDNCYCQVLTNQFKEELWGTLQFVTNFSTDGENLIYKTAATARMKVEKGVDFPVQKRRFILMVALQSFSTEVSKYSVSIICQSHIILKFCFKPLCGMTYNLLTCNNLPSKITGPSTAMDLLIYTQIINFFISSRSYF